MDELRRPSFKLGPGVRALTAPIYGQLGSLIHYAARPGRGLRPGRDHDRLRRHQGDLLGVVFGLRLDAVLSGGRAA
jgi:hypothetical protein